MNRTLRPLPPVATTRSRAVSPRDGRRFEHGSHDAQTDFTHDDPIVTGKIALAHMKEFPDYCERLERMEDEAEREWAAERS